MIHRAIERVMASIGFSEGIAGYFLPLNVIFVFKCSYDIGWLQHDFQSEEFSDMRILLPESGNQQDSGKISTPQGCGGSVMLGFCGPKSLRGWESARQWNRILG
ncbi:hypothetical protein SUGI_0711150 [Cryptomeria japonica]|nr:hypothetical protein SUGI_0711150 [Cryptomeria japonica]